MKDVHVTIYDVAARAGVSAATASRALAGLPVSKAALARVEAAAAELGYVPNEAARSLRVVRTMTVGMVFNELTSRLGIELLGGLSASLDEKGYSLFVSTAQGDAGRYDRLVRRFLERRVDALVCVHGRGEGASLERFLAAGIPAVALISASGGYARLPRIGTGIVGAAKAASERLAALGHRSAVVVTPPFPVSLVADAQAALRAAGLAVSEHPAGREGLDAEALLAGVGGRGQPSAVVALQSDAVRLLEAGDRAGRPTPQAFSLVAIRDRSMFQQPTRLPLSMIHVDPRGVASAAATGLIRWLDEKIPLAPETRVEAGSWREGETIGPAKR